MKIDDQIAKLICELENIIGNQTYNPNSYNGWTGETGQEYKYPVSYCATKKDMDNYVSSRTRYLKSIPPECVKTMKYEFGSNHLYIGDGIVKMLKYLEERYGLDFNELELLHGDPGMSEFVKELNKKKRIIHTIPKEQRVQSIETLKVRKQTLDYLRNNGFVTIGDIIAKQEQIPSEFRGNIYAYLIFGVED